MGFFLYTFVLSLIRLYASSGRNPGGAGAKDLDGGGGIELRRTKWYERIPNAEADGVQHHVVGDDD